MRFKAIALNGAAIIVLAGIVATPALAFTHHPSTPAEQQQTDDLNGRALEAARGTAPAQTPAQTIASADAQPASAKQTASLDTIANPPQTLANASVEASNGESIGAVQKVIMGADGKANLVDVALLTKPSKVVEIDAASLSYDQSRNVVVALSSADEIKAMPAAPQS